MRILYIVTAFPRWDGDVITPWLSETIHHLALVGIAVEVLAPSYMGCRDQVIEGIPVHRFRYAPAAWETLTHDQTAPDRLRERPVYMGLVPSYMLSGSVAAVQLARSHRFDLIHAFWPIPHSVLGMAASYAGAIPLVSTFFGVELSWVRGRMTLYRPVLEAIVRHSEAVTAISSYTAAALWELVPSAEPVIVPFGATVEPPSDIDVASHARRPFEILFVGRLVERKGVEVLLESIARLRHHRAVRLRIVGDGPIRPELEASVAALGIEGIVEFTGLVSDELLERSYRDCSVLVLPAVIDSKGDTEGLGVVLIEALIQGRPVIASDIGGIPDIVRHGETGILVPPGDPEALAGALRRYIDDPALASRLAAAGRAHVEQNFSWNAITTRLQRLYGQVMERQRGKTA